MRIATFAPLVISLLLGSPSVSAASERPIFGAMLAGSPGRPMTLFSVQKGYPAYLAGLREGDEILEVNGVELDDPVEVGALIREQGAKVSTLRIRRGDEEFFVGVRPWLTPDSDRDAEMFPYVEDTARTALAARIDGRDYPLIEQGGVFKLDNLIGLDAPQGRVAFRARVETCVELERLAGPIAQPGGDPMHRLSSVRSLLFDFDLAREERIACVEYMREKDLTLSSPVVVVAGRFVEDASARVSNGGVVLLIDALKFDHAHVTLGERFVSVVTQLGETGLFGE